MNIADRAPSGPPALGETLASVSTEELLLSLHHSLGKHTLSDRQDMLGLHTSSSSSSSVTGSSSIGVQQQHRQQQQQKLLLRVRQRSKRAVMDAVFSPSVALLQSQRPADGVKEHLKELMDETRSSLPSTVARHLFHLLSAPVLVEHGEEVDGSVHAKSEATTAVALKNTKKEDGKGGVKGILKNSTGGAASVTTTTRSRRRSDDDSGLTCEEKILYIILRTGVYPNLAGGRGSGSQRGAGDEHWAPCYYSSESSDEEDEIDLSTDSLPKKSRRLGDDSGARLVFTNTANRYDAAMEKGGDSGGDADLKGAGAAEAEGGEGRQASEQYQHWRSLIPSTVAATSLSFATPAPGAKRPGSVVRTHRHTKRSGRAAAAAVATAASVLEKGLWMSPVCARLVESSLRLKRATRWSLEADPVVAATLTAANSGSGHHHYHDSHRGGSRQNTSNLTYEERAKFFAALTSGSNSSGGGGKGERLWLSPADAAAGDAVVNLCYKLAHGDTSTTTTTAINNSSRASSDDGWFWHALLLSSFASEEEYRFSVSCDEHLSRSGLPFQRRLLAGGSGDGSAGGEEWRQQQQQQLRLIEVPLASSVLPLRTEAGEGEGAGGWPALSTEDPQAAKLFGRKVRKTSKSSERLPPRRAPSDAEGDTSEIRLMPVCGTESGYARHNEQEEEEEGVEHVVAPASLPLFSLFKNIYDEKTCAMLFVALHCCVLGLEDPYSLLKRDEGTTDADTRGESSSRSRSRSRKTAAPVPMEHREISIEVSPVFHRFVGPTGEEVSGHGNRDQGDEEDPRSMRTPGPRPKAARTEKSESPATATEAAKARERKSEGGAGELTMTRGALSLLHWGCRCGTLCLRLQRLCDLAERPSHRAGLGSYGQSAARALRIALSILHRQVFALAEQQPGGGLRGLRFNDVLEAQERLQTAVVEQVELLALVFGVRDGEGWIATEALQRHWSSATLLSSLYGHLVRQKAANAMERYYYGSSFSSLQEEMEWHQRRWRAEQQQRVPGSGGGSSSSSKNLGDIEENRFQLAQRRRLYTSKLDVLQFVFSAAVWPLHRMMHAWLTEGQLRDPMDEFFIQPSHGATTSGFLVDSSPQRLPSFVSAEAAVLLLEAGLSLRVLRVAGTQVTLRAEHEKRRLERLASLDLSPADTSAQGQPGRAALDEEAAQRERDGTAMIASVVRQFMNALGDSREQQQQHYRHQQRHVSGAPPEPAVGNDMMTTTTTTMPALPRVDVLHPRGALAYWTSFYGSCNNILLRAVQGDEDEEGDEPDTEEEDEREASAAANENDEEGQSVIVEIEEVLQDNEANEEEAGSGQRATSVAESHISIDMDESLSDVELEEAVRKTAPRAKPKKTIVTKGSPVVVEFVQEVAMRRKVEEAQMASSTSSSSSSAAASPLNSSGSAVSSILGLREAQRTLEQRYGYPSSARRHHTRTGRRRGKVATARSISSSSMSSNATRSLSGGGGGGGSSASSSRSSRVMSALYGAMALETRLDSRGHRYRPLLSPHGSGADTAGRRSERGGDDGGDRGERGEDGDGNEREEDEGKDEASVVKGMKRSYEDELRQRRLEQRRQEWRGERLALHHQRLRQLQREVGDIQQMHEEAKERRLVEQAEENEEKETDKDVAGGANGLLGAFVERFSPEALEEIMEVGRANNNTLFPSSDTIASRNNKSGALDSTLSRPKRVAFLEEKEGEEECAETQDDSVPGGTYSKSHKPKRLSSPGKKSTAPAASFGDDGNEDDRRCSSTGDEMGARDSLIVFKKKKVVIDMLKGSSAGENENEEDEAKGDRYREVVVAPPSSANLHLLRQRSVSNSLAAYLAEVQASASDAPQPTQQPGGSVRYDSNGFPHDDAMYVIEDVNYAGPAYAGALGEAGEGGSGHDTTNMAASMRSHWNQAAYSKLLSDMEKELQRWGKNSAVRTTTVTAVGSRDAACRVQHSNNEEFLGHCQAMGALLRSSVAAEGGEEAPEAGEERAQLQKEWRYFQSTSWFEDLTLRFRDDDDDEGGDGQSKGASRQAFAPLKTLTDESFSALFYAAPDNNAAAVNALQLGNAQTEAVLQCPLYYLQLARTARRFLTHKALQFMLLPPLGPLYSLTQQLLDVCLLQSPRAAVALTGSWCAAIDELFESTTEEALQVALEAEEEAAAAGGAAGLARRHQYSAAALQAGLERAGRRRYWRQFVERFNKDFGFWWEECGEAAGSGGHRHRSNTNTDCGTEWVSTMPSEEELEGAAAAAAAEDSTQPSKGRRGEARLMSPLEFLTTLRLRDAVTGEAQLLSSHLSADCCRLLMPVGFLARYQDLLCSSLFWKAVERLFTQLWRVGLESGVPDVFFFVSCARQTLRHLQKHFWSNLSACAAEYRASLAVDSAELYSYRRLVGFTEAHELFLQECRFYAFLTPRLLKPSRGLIYSLVRQVEEVELEVRTSLHRVWAARQQTVKELERLVREREELMWRQELEAAPGVAAAAAAAGDKKSTKRRRRSASVTPRLITTKSPASAKKGSAPSASASPSSSKKQQHRKKKREREKDEEEEEETEPTHTDATAGTRTVEAIDEEMAAVRAQGERHLRSVTATQQRHIRHLVRQRLRVFSELLELLLANLQDLARLCGEALASVSYASRVAGSHDSSSHSDEAKRVSEELTKTLASLFEEEEEGREEAGDGSRCDEHGGLIDRTGAMEAQDAKERQAHRQKALQNRLQQLSALVRVLEPLLAVLNSKT